MYICVINHFLLLIHSGTCLSNVVVLPSTSGSFTFQIQSLSVKLG